MTDMLRPGKALATPANADDPYSDPVPVSAAPAAAGREMDAAIAEKVMGWTHVRFIVGGMLRGNPAEYHIGHEVPYYSTDIAAAWLVVDLLFRGNLDVTLQTLGARWRCSVSSEPRFWSVYRTADTAPHAICLAALAAVEHDSAALACTNRAADHGDRTP